MRPRPDTYARRWRIVVDVIVRPASDLAHVDRKRERSDVGYAVFGALVDAGAKVVRVDVFGEGAFGTPDWSLDGTTGEVSQR
jgi:hypothetical protein